MSDFIARLELAKAALPLDALMTSLGYGPEFQKPSCKSPFRHEKTPSFGVFRTKDGELKWRDFTTGVSGDQIDFLAEHLDCSSKEAIVPFFKMAMPNGFPEDDFNGHRHGNGNGAKHAAGGHRKPQTPPRPCRPAPEPESPTELRPFDWAACVEALTQEHIDAIVEARGYAPEFVAWLKAKELLGIYRGFPATPVLSNGVVVGCQFKGKDGPRYANNTPNAKTPTEILMHGDPAEEFMVVMESPWDGFSLMEMSGHFCLPMPICFAMTRSASNTAKLLPLLEARAKSNAPKVVVLLGQNDKSRPDGRQTGHDTLENGVRDLCANLGLAVKVVFPPKEANGKEIKDFNDWAKADRANLDPGATCEFLDGAQIKTTSTLSHRRVRSLLGLPDSDADNYFGDRVYAAGQATSLLGAPGTGKSRYILQKAICMILGLDFIGMPTHAKGMKWLFIQTENSNRRLKTDLGKMIRGLKLTEDQIDVLDECLIFHTLEHDKDGFVNLDNKEDLLQVERFIADFCPSFVVFDPLNTFSGEDIDNDSNMRNLCMLISRAVKRGNPNRVAIVVHHALTGMAGVQRAVGWDKGSFGRNSKALNAWVRSQINLVVRDKDDNTKLMASCGKNNNGKEFPAVGIIFNEEAWLYEVDPDFKLEDFYAAISQTKAGPGRPTKDPDFGMLLEILGDESMPKSKLHALLLKNDPQLKTRNAYNLITAAENSRLITVMKLGGKDYCSRK